MTLPGRLDPLNGGAQEQLATPVDIKADPKLGSSEDGDWITIGEDVPTPVIPTPSLSKPSRGIAEYIAQVRHSGRLRSPVLPLNSII